MPNIADSPAAALPLQPTDRLYGERAGQAVKEFQLADIVALAQAGMAPASHTHAGLMTPAQAEKLNGLPTAALLEADQAAQDQAIAGKADAGHTHTPAAIGAATAAQGAKADTALQPGVLPVGTTLPAAQISDATAAGRVLLTAADAAAQRTALALGNVSNTADADKPVSTAQALAITAATTADAIADTLEAAATGAPADLARIQASVSGGWFTHLVAYGQSNSLGYDSYPVVPAAIYDDAVVSAYKPNVGTDTWGVGNFPTAPGSRKAWRMVDMQQDAGNGSQYADNKDSPLVAATRSLSARMGGALVFGTASGDGGKYLSELSAEDSCTRPENAGARGPGGYWLTTLDDAVRAKALATIAGQPYRAAMWYTQGEAEGTRRIYAWEAQRTFADVRAVYKTKLLEMIAQWRAASGNAPFLISQPGSSTVVTPVHVEVCGPAAGVYAVGPMYQYQNALNITRPTGGARGDVAHYSPDGSRWHGEMVAKVLQRVLAGEPWQGMRCIAATRISSTQVDLAITVPRAPMVIDTTWIPKRQFWGICAYSGTPDALGTQSAVTAVTVTDDGSATGVGTLRLTFTPALAAGGFVRLGISKEYDATTTDLTVAAVAAGPVVNGQATTDITVTGDVRSKYPMASRTGFYILKKTGPGTATQFQVDSISLVGGNTVFRGETRTWAGTGQAVATDVWRPADFAFGTNIRDSDPAISRTIFRDTGYGSHAGTRPPLWNWLMTGDVTIA